MLNVSIGSPFVKEKRCVLHDSFNFSGHGIQECVAQKGTRVL